MNEKSAENILTLPMFALENQGVIDEDPHVE